MNTILVFTLVVTLNFNRSGFTIENIATQHECQAMQADIVKTFGGEGTNAKCYGFRRVILQQSQPLPQQLKR